MAQNTNLSSEVVRSGVLRVFENCRQTPGEPFDDTRFLSFLTSDQSIEALKVGTGRNRFYRFYDAIEDEFQVYIGDKRKRKDWNLRDFCEYLARAVKNRKSSVPAAKYYVDRLAGCMVILAIVGIPMVGGAIVLLGMLFGAWVASIIVVVPIAALIWRMILRDFLRYRRIIKSSSS